MKKVNNKPNLFEDISVFEHVAGDQNPETKANFEKALSENLNLQEDVNSEQEFRALIEQSQPSEAVSADNIKGLFELIDEDTKTESNPTESASNIVRPNFTSRIAGSAIAASLLVAVFFSLNFSNDLLEPKFQTLSDSDNLDNVDLSKLSNENRLIKISLSAPLSSIAADTLLDEYQLSSLNRSVDATSIVAQSNKLINDQALSLLQADVRIQNVELIKFDNNTK